MLALIGLASCHEEECDHSQGGTPPTSKFTYDYVSAGTGSWFEEAVAEEFRATASGKFYDRYCNAQRSGETEGTYEISENGTRMTEYYKYMGQSQENSLKVGSVTDYSFVLSDDKIGTHKYEKIIDEYTLSEGQQVSVKSSANLPGGTVTSVSSLNPNIATVSTDGIVTATGEKGTAYIKIATAEANVWAKVTVGSNVVPLWMDYSLMLGANYSELRQQLGEPDNTGAVNNRFTFILQNHDVIKYINVFINPNTQKATYIDIYLKDIPEPQLTSFLETMYYVYGQTSDVKFYTTSKDPKTSRAVYAYSPSQKCIQIAKPDAGLWTDFTPLFGYTQSQIKAEMDFEGYDFLQSDYSYSADGSDYYQVSNGTISMVGFVFNADKQMCEYWVYLKKNTTSEINAVRNFLGDNYHYDSTESNSSAYVYYDADRTVRIEFDRSGYVAYKSLTVKEKTAPEPWSDYTADLGKTRSQIKTAYGSSPISEDESIIMYVSTEQNIRYLAFSMNTSTDKVKAVSLMLKDNIDKRTVLDYLNGQYTVFENGTLADGSQYAWINADKVANATVGIIYSPGNKMVQYLDLGGASNARAFFVER